MDIETVTKQAMSVLKKGQEVIVHGMNKDIETYYQIWKGKPEWLDYSYRLTNGQVISTKYKTLNIPRYLCRTWANNYANEDTKITIPGDKDNDLLQDVFSNTNLFGRFNNFTEMFMGLGIGATVVEIDVEMDVESRNIIKSDKSELKIKMIPGRRIVPITVDDGETIECAFFSYITGGARLTIHYLDDKDEYHIAIFKGTGTSGEYNFEFENYVDIPTRAGKDTPLFQIWEPNLTEEDEVDKCTGVSIFATALDTFKHLDLGYTAYYKEVKLGQKVKFISSDQLDFDEEGKEVLPFDEEDESVIFIKNATDAPTQMQEFNGQLRVDMLTKYINTNLNCAAMLCGLGQTQFEFDGGGGRPIQTATGVIAKQTELYRNVVKQENLATAKFKQLVMAIVHMNNEFTTKPKINIKNKKDIQIVYDDNIVEDTSSKKQSELSEVQAGVMSIAEFRSHWYDEDYDTALQFVQENGLLLDKYTIALQSKVITPEIFIDLVFGENYKHKTELLKYLQEQEQLAQQASQPPTGFENESSEDDEDENKDDE